MIKPLIAFLRGGKKKRYEKRKNVEKAQEEEILIKTHTVLIHDGWGELPPSWTVREHIEGYTFRFECMHFEEYICIREYVIPDAGMLPIDEMSSRAFNYIMYEYSKRKRKNA